MTTTNQRRTARRRVRAWFGEYINAEFVGDHELAQRYEDAMCRRFAGLRVTNELIPTVGEPRS